MFTDTGANWKKRGLARGVPHKEEFTLKGEVVAAFLKADHQQYFTVRFSEDLPDGFTAGTVDFRASYMTSLREKEELPEAV